mgnify:CR=1 FL=1
MGEVGCVSWLFSPKGLLTITVEGKDPDTIFEAAVEAGAEDVRVEGDTVEIETALEDLEHIRTNLQKAGFTVETAHMAMVPSFYAQIDEKSALQVLKLIEGDIRGRLVLFFPGQLEGNNYRLLDARDGWNYLAVPISQHGEGAWV